MIALLDTHVLLWWFSDDKRLSVSHKRVIRRASAASPLWVSEISLWEIATLYELGRVRLRLPLRDWLEAATAPPLVRRFGITPAVAAEVAVLPATFHRDPAGPDSRRQRPGPRGDAAHRGQPDPGRGPRGDAGITLA